MVEVDAIIGEIVKALEETGELENTFIFVTSDNGPQLDAWPDGGYTPFRGAKGSAWEGGVRVPGIAYWKGTIAPGRESDDLFDLMDLFNTSLNLAGVADKIPTDRYIDGIDQTSFLLADDGRSNREKVYIWNEQDLMAMRMYEYKIHLKVVQEQAQWLNIDMTTVSEVGLAPWLFNLYIDPKEQYPVGHRMNAWLASMAAEMKGARGDLQEISAEEHRAGAVEATGTAFAETAMQLRSKNAAKQTRERSFCVPCSNTFLLASALALAAPAQRTDRPGRRLGAAVPADADGGQGGRARCRIPMMTWPAEPQRLPDGRAEHPDRAARRRRLRHCRNVRRRGPHADAGAAGRRGHRLQRVPHDLDLFADARRAADRPQPSRASATARSPSGRSTSTATPACIPKTLGDDRRGARRTTATTPPPSASGTTRRRPRRPRWGRRTAGRTAMASTISTVFSPARRRSGSRA